MFGSLWWTVVVEGLSGQHRGVQASLDMDAMLCFCLALFEPEHQGLLSLSLAWLPVI